MMQGWCNPEIILRGLADCEVQGKVLVVLYEENHRKRHEPIGMTTAGIRELLMKKYGVTYREVNLATICRMLIQKNLCVIASTDDAETPAYALTAYGIVWSRTILGEAKSHNPHFMKYVTRSTTPNTSFARTARAGVM